MSWSPANNQYDGVNATPVNDVELNAPFYVWDLIYVGLAPVKLYSPLLTSSPGSLDPNAPEGEERAHSMRLMIVPPELGRGTC